MRASASARASARASANGVEVYCCLAALLVLLVLLLCLLTCCLYCLDLAALLPYCLAAFAAFAALLPCCLAALLPCCLAALLPLLSCCLCCLAAFAVLLSCCFAVLLPCCLAAKIYVKVVICLHSLHAFFVFPAWLAICLKLFDSSPEQCANFTVLPLASLLLPPAPKPKLKNKGQRQQMVGSIPNPPFVQIVFDSASASGSDFDSHCLTSAGQEPGGSNLKTALVAVEPCDIKNGNQWFVFNRLV